MKRIWLSIAVSSEIISPFPIRNMPSAKRLRFSSDGDEIDATGADQSVHDYGGEDMYIIVIVNGWRPVHVNAWVFDTIAHVKAKLQIQEGIPRASQSLFRNGENLQDDRTLAHLRIRMGEVLVLLTDGGASPSSSPSAADVRMQHLQEENRALRRAIMSIQQKTYDNGCYDIVFRDGDDTAP
jgi:hypothetical protein